MGRAPEHIPEKQEKRFIDEMRRQGKMRLFLVVRQTYERFGGGCTELELHEAVDITDLLKQLDWTGTLESLREVNGDGMDLFIISELIVKKEGGVEESTAKKLWEMLLKRECVALKPILEEE